MALNIIQRPHDDIAHQRRAKLEQALHKLHPVHKTVLTLRFFGHVSTQQIALTLSCSVASVQVLQHQALVELQRMLAYT